MEELINHILTFWPVEWAFAPSAAFRHILVFNRYYLHSFVLCCAGE